MKVKNKKPLKLALVIVALMLLAFSYLSFSNSKKGNSVVIKELSNNNRASNNVQENTLQEEPVNNSNSNSNAQAAPDQGTKEENSENQQDSVPLATLAKSQIIDYINKNINNLAPAPPHAGVWSVKRYWFASNNDVYVEYESDGELKQVLISVDTNNTDPNYTRKATFKAGESSWVLTEGEDTQFGKTKELYEKVGEEWIKKN